MKNQNPFKGLFGEKRDKRTFVVAIKLIYYQLKLFIAPEILNFAYLLLSFYLKKGTLPNSKIIYHL
jgi:hypothetical protein